MVGAYMACLIFKKVKKRKSHSSNHVMTNFFYAPVELFFTVNQAMGISTKMDIAMIMQNVIIAAKARGLDTFPQAA